MTEDEMVGWYQQLDGHGSEQAPGVRDGQGSLTCCSPQGRRRTGHGKTLESPLDCKEVQPVHPKGNQS